MPAADPLVGMAISTVTAPFSASNYGSINAFTFVILMVSFVVRQAFALRNAVLWRF